MIYFRGVFLGGVALLVISGLCIAIGIGLVIFMFILGANKKKAVSKKTCLKISVIDQNMRTWDRCGSRIWSRGGPQLLRPTVADVAKRSRVSEASILRPGSMARLRALEAFGFLMLKYAFSHILDTLFLLFLTFILTPKVDKNRALDFTSINLRHSDMLHLFFNLHEKVML